LSRIVQNSEENQVCTKSARKKYVSKKVFESFGLGENCQAMSPLIDCKVLRLWLSILPEDFFRFYLLVTRKQRLRHILDKSLLA